MARESGRATLPRIRAEAADVPNVDLLVRRLIERGLVYRTGRATYDFALPLFPQLHPTGPRTNRTNRICENRAPDPSTPIRRGAHPIPRAFRIAWPSPCPRWQPSRCCRVHRVRPHQARRDPACAGLEARTRPGESRGHKKAPIRAQIGPMRAELVPRTGCAENRTMRVNVTRLTLCGQHGAHGAIS
jgi:hypothetical protein